MSVKKKVGIENTDDVKSRGEDVFGSKRRRFSGCFSFKEVSIEPAGSRLKEVDSNKLKDEIRRWAKAVVAYARQVSGRFGSSRGGDRFGSSRGVSFRPSSKKNFN